MKIYPMIFSGEMVRAMLAGRKVSTRRPVKNLPENFCAGSIEDFVVCKAPVKPGDLIWVRETFQGPLVDENDLDRYQENNTPFHTPKFCVYAATGKKEEFENLDGETLCRWTPSIHMPKWASRLTLRVTAVTVQRLQDMTEAQAVSEGVEPLPKGNNGFYHAYFPLGNKNGLRCAHSALKSFSGLWDVIYGTWKDNPWVWLFEFEVHHANFNELIQPAAA